MVDRCWLMDFICKFALEIGQPSTINHQRNNLFSINDYYASFPKKIPAVWPVPSASWLSSVPAESGGTKTIILHVGLPGLDIR
jgi:hypothetical protein